MIRLIASCHQSSVISSHTVLVWICSCFCVAFVAFVSLSLLLSHFCCFRILTFVSHLSLSCHFRCLRLTFVGIMLLSYFRCFHTVAFVLLLLSHFRCFCLIFVGIMLPVSHSLLSYDGLREHCGVVRADRHQHGRYLDDDGLMCDWLLVAFSCSSPLSPSLAANSATISKPMLPTATSWW